MPHIPSSERTAVKSKENLGTAGGLNQDVQDDFEMNGMAGSILDILFHPDRPDSNARKFPRTLSVSFHPAGAAIQRL
jgi:hypothetical protein